MPKYNPETRTRRFHDTLKRLSDTQLTSLEQSVTGLAVILKDMKGKERLLVLGQLLDLPDRTQFFAKFKALRAAEADLLKLDGKREGK